MFNGKRARELREEAKLTQQELASRVGVARQTILSWEKGIFAPDAENLHNLATALGTSVSELLNESHIPRKETTRIATIPDQKLVPILHPSFLACAGDGHNLHGVTMEASEHIPISEKDLGTAGELPVFGVRVEGTSMEAADIKDGSVAIINPNQEIRYGDPCLVCFGIDEAAIKFVYPQPGGGLRIESADPSYKKHQFTKEEVEGGLVRVVGPVVATVWIGKPKRGI
jgi:transcriptional regulator with XRE-family HTH domain